MKKTKHGWKRSFFTITAGQTISLVGSSAVQFSLIWWLASETGSPLVMSMAGLFAFLPQLFLGPFVGVWIDRLKRKTVIICADLFVGLAALVMAALFLAGHTPFSAVYMVLALRSVGNVFHQPAIQAAIPMLVPQDQLVKANGWGQFLQSGAFMLGPVLGAAMFAALPLWVILLTDTAGAIVASLAVAVVEIPDPPRAQQQKPQLWAELKEGAAALVLDKPLLIVTLVSVLAMVFYMPLSSYYPLMSSDHFDVTAWHAGLVELVYALGMMATALVFSRFGNLKNKIAVVHGGCFLLGLTSLACGLLPADIHWFWLFAVFCCLMGASGNIYNIPYVAYMQETIPAEKMGRVFSLVGSLSSLAMPLGLLIAGPVSEANGVARWFLVAGIAICLLTVLSVLAVGRVKHTGKADK